MRHLKKGRKFHRIKGQRRAFLRNLTNDLVRRGKIETTEARAKEIRPIAEKLITIAKSGSLTSRRLILKRVGVEHVAEKLCGEIGPRYKDRNGGYLRVVKLGTARKRDGSRLARIELV